MTELSANAQGPADSTALDPREIPGIGLAFGPPPENTPTAGATQLASFALTIFAFMGLANLGANAQDIVSEQINNFQETGMEVASSGSGALVQTPTTAPTPAPGVDLTGPSMTNGLG